MLKKYVLVIGLFRLPLIRLQVPANGTLMTMTATVFNRWWVVLKFIIKKLLLQSLHNCEISLIIYVCIFTTCTHNTGSSVVFQVILDWPVTAWSWEVFRQIFVRLCVLKRANDWMSCFFISRLLSGRPLLSLHCPCDSSTIHLCSFMLKS